MTDPHTLAAGLCLLCETPLAERQPDEQIRNGMHGYCVLANTSGHLVRACRCYPDTDDMTDRDVAVLAGTRWQTRPSRKRKTRRTMDRVEPRTETVEPARDLADEASTRPDQP